jgi:hypothetical protein
MKKIFFFILLMAWLTGGCAWYKIQPVSANSLGSWGKTNALPEGYIFYQPELYFSATIVTDSAGKQSITVASLWLPNYQKPYRLTTHNFLARADFAFNFENGWKLTQIADKGDNSTMADTLAGQLATALKTAGFAATSNNQLPKEQIILFRPTVNPTNGFISGFEKVSANIEN